MVRRKEFFSTLLTVKLTPSIVMLPLGMINTLFESYKVGSKINIETDMFARYLYHMFSSDKNVSWDMVDSIMARY